jgi:hypothetical protein
MSEYRGIIPEKMDHKAKAPGHHSGAFAIGIQQVLDLSLSHTLGFPG